MTIIAFHRCAGFTTAAFLIWLAAVPQIRADDLTTLSGTTYRQVRMVRVEPDGVVWEHATGMCKVDFTDSPEDVRRTFHYDAKRAAAFQAAQAQAHQQTAERTQQDKREAEARRTRFVQEQASASVPDNQPGVFVRRLKAGDAAATRSVGEQLDANKNAQETLTRDDGTVWDRRLWAVPNLIVGGGYNPGVAFDPHVDLNPVEYKAGLHHKPGGFASDSLHDDYFKADYTTKSYYQDVERSEAFARGRP